QSACCVIALVVVACGKSGPRVATEPLVNTNTVCYESYTFDLPGFGDAERFVETDTSYLVIHGLADTVVDNTAGSAWLALAANGWRPWQNRWRKVVHDSVAVTIQNDSVRQVYQLALYEEGAQGVGLEYDKAADDSEDPIASWDMVLGRIHCSGMREPQDPPVRKPRKPMA
ncbi:MAG: hypothetical protein JSW51_05480, partial [Gemmatimonadota bacterium]